MDDTSKKLIAQFDDPMPGQRQNAFEMQHSHMEKNSWSWRGWLADLEEAAKNKAEADALRRTNAQLSADNAKFRSANLKWSARYYALAGAYGAAVAVGFGKRLAVYAALPVIALVGWQSYQRFSWPAAVDEGLRRLAVSEEWKEGYGQPFVRVIAGKPYWVLTFGDSDTSDHATAQGGPVGLHCVHVYAAPAEPDFGQFVKASPYRFGWWVKWPERAVDCKSFSVVAANAFDGPNPYARPPVPPETPIKKAR
jgi:hypothetical protein